MPIYAGIDIGAKNLAVCIIDSSIWKKYEKGQTDDVGIILWKNIDALGEGEKCNTIMKSGKVKGTLCNKKAIWVSNKCYYCGKHKPKEDCEKYISPKCNKFTMAEIKKKAFIELDKIDIFKQVNHIRIETQPRINMQMKLFAASIETYFIIRNYIDNPNSNLKTIRNSPAHNKLKIYNGPPISVTHTKNPYTQRKYLGQKHTEYFISNSPKSLAEFYSFKKRDDVADAFLHCLYAIKGKSNI